MKNLRLFVLVFVSILEMFIIKSEAVIYDHRAVPFFNMLPDAFVKQAKEHYRIAYGHEQFGNQVISGMNWLSNEWSIYKWNREGKDGGISLYNYYPEGTIDKNGVWENSTRAILNFPMNDRNMIVWGWENQMSNYSEIEVDDYLERMNKMEHDYPHVTFVYMTGHVDGTGPEGNSNERNEQIRRYVMGTKKLLFDFADVESHDPLGNDYLDEFVNDDCSYNGGNWAVDFCEKHSTSKLCECRDCKCRPRSDFVSCIMKSRVFWVLLVDSSGWDKYQHLNGSSCTSCSSCLSLLIIGFLAFYFSRFLH